MQTFTGFTPDLFDFLAELAMNNTREWFEGQKSRYEASVRGPAQALIRAMAPRLTPLSPHIVADDRKVGGSLMRIHRDTRFGSDKTPYKTNVGIQFRHSAGKDVHAPGLYLHIAHPGPGEMDGLFLGAGIYHPEKEPLEQIRQAIAEKPDAWRAVREDAAFAGTWTLGGESLKRPPRGFDPAHPFITDIQRKDFIGVADLSMDDVVRADLPDVLAARFMAARPLMAFLCAATGEAF